MMKISTKGRYALRMMLDLAEHKDDGYISLKDVAERQNISKNYLDQIMMLLKKSNFLKATRGYQGGYKLAKEPSSYSVGDILRLTEGELSPVPCLENEEECERSIDCMAFSVWKGLEDVMLKYLDNLTLQEIIEQHKGNEGSNFVI